jgi:hypothetical protein
VFVTLGSCDVLYSKWWVWREKVGLSSLVVGMVVEGEGWFLSSLVVGMVVEGEGWFL